MERGEAEPREVIPSLPEIAQRAGCRCSLTFDRSEFRERPHVLILDEIDRPDLSRLLSEYRVAERGHK